VTEDGGAGLGDQLTTWDLVGARQRSLRERFSADELQAMINLYISGATRAQIAERFGVSVSSVKRLLRDHGIRKQAAAYTVVTKHQVPGSNF
jgi:transposase-like protein